MFRPQERQLGHIAFTLRTYEEILHSLFYKVHMGK